MITKAFNVDSLWKSEMYKSGHIPISIKDQLKNDDLCNTCYKRNYLILNHFNESYFINPLAIRYSEYSNKYWEGVKERQRRYRLNRTV
jgi:hypothetical protein